MSGGIRRSGDRRFRAEPNACPACGPRIALWNGHGHPLATGRDALATTADAIRDGRLVAVKGIGGFHLVCDARNNDAVQRLRDRKRREEKPFAVMFPSLEDARDELPDFGGRRSAADRSPTPDRAPPPDRRAGGGGGGAGQSPAGRAPPLCAPPSPADERPWLSNRRDQRQCQRRADRHRRARSDRAAVADCRPLPRP